MRIEIKNLKSIQKRAKVKWNSGTALISIGDTDAPNPMLEHMPEWLLRLVFDDVYLEDEDEEIDPNFFTLFNDNLAERIVNFVCQHKNNIETLICQCEHGQSRSAAVAAAVAQYINGESAEFFSDERYCPNKTVFHKVLHKFFEVTRKDSMTTWSRIEEICKQKLKDLYGESIPDEISERFTTEFCQIVRYSLEDKYFLAHQIAKKTYIDGVPIGFRGAIGNSFVAFLLGITEVDPLKYGLPFEVYDWADFGKSVDIHLNVSTDYTDVILDYIKKSFFAETIIIPKKNSLAIIALPTELIKEYAGYDHQYLLERFAHIEIFESDILALIKKLEDMTGVKARTIPLDDEKALEIFRDCKTSEISLFDDEFLCSCVLSEIDIRSIDELVKALGLKLGTVDYPPMDLMFNKTAKFSELLAYRDEVFIGLMQYGVEREIAFRMMEHFNKGKGLTHEYKHLMKCHHVPEWFIKSCEKTLYLFPKAHGVVHTLEAFRLAWYKAHYPDAFRTITKT
ncbi:MAG: hypothetical protein PHE51_11000 [Eubacteriales bacterium]|nr:hypothetical protein [Eubacteriales bacterium]